MEYFKHGDLQHYLYSAPPLPESDGQQIAFQVLEGLHFMHENGYSHRDLKPSVSTLAPCGGVSTSNIVHGNRIS
jgi:serine/threonine protein kinase